MGYSQNDEERFILAACPAFGRFLDIGAFSAYALSNTRALYERNWTGVLVEPSPGPFRLLRAAYAAAPLVKVIHAAVVLEPVAEVAMHISDDAVSTTEDANFEKWKDDARFIGRRMVPAITLERLFEEYGEFDFISIDTEGTSVDLLLRIFSLEKRPKCICVEYDGRADEVLSAASTVGYECLYTSGENLVLAR